MPFDWRCRNPGAEVRLGIVGLPLPRVEQHMALVHLDQHLVGERFPPLPMLFELCSNAEPQRSLQGETDEEVAVELEILLEMY